MGFESIALTVSTETGASCPARGRLLVYPQGLRTVVALIWLAVGFGGALALIVVPIVHLISTWALPLIGILCAINALKTHARVSHVEGECPGCGGKLLLAGGRAVFPVRDACEHCSRPLLLSPAEA